MFLKGRLLILFRIPTVYRLWQSLTVIRTIIRRRFLSGSGIYQLPGIGIYHIERCSTSLAFLTA